MSVHRLVPRFGALLAVLAWVLSYPGTGIAQEAVPSGGRPLYLAPLDEASLVVLDKLCDIIRARGAGLGYSDVRLFLDPEDRMLRLVQKLEARSETGKTATAEAQVAKDTLWNLKTSASCMKELRQGSRPAANGASPLAPEPNLRPPYEMLWVKAVGTKFYRLKVVAVPDAETKKERWEPDTWLEVTTDGDALSTARVLGWGSLAVEQTRPLWIDSVNVEGPSEPCRPSTRRACFALGRPLRAVVKVSGSEWISAADVAWRATLRCSSKERGDHTTELKPPPAATRSQELQAKVAGASERWISAEIPLELVWAETCKISAEAWSRVRPEKKVSAESGDFHLQTRGFTIEKVLLDKSEKIARRTRLSFTLNARAAILGLGHERTNREEIEEQVWSLQAVSGADVQRAANDFIEAIRKIPTDLGYEKVVKEAVDHLVDTRGHLLGGELFDLDDQVCSPVVRRIRQQAALMAAVTTFPDDWASACEKGKERAVNSVAPRRPLALHVQPHGSAPSTAIHALRGDKRVVGAPQAWIPHGKRVFAETVDKPFGRNELYDVELVLHPEEKPRSIEQIRIHPKELASFERTEPAIWTVHQTAAPIDLRVGLSAGYAFTHMWRTRLDGTYYVPHQQVFESGATGGFFVTLGILRDALGVRVSPTWLPTKVTRKLSVPLTVEANLPCINQRLQPDSKEMRVYGQTTSDVDCLRLGLRTLAGYDLTIRAVSIGAEMDFGFRVVDLLEIRPGLGVHFGALTERPVATGEFPGFMLSAQGHLAFTFMDRTVIF